MENIKEHIKNNFAIYSVILACIIVVLVTLFITSKPKVEELDTSMFKVVTLKEAIELFETDEPKMLVMSIKTCSATINYEPYLQIAQAKNGYNTYYLELSDIDPNSKDFKTLQSKLDMEYNFQGTVDKFSTFMENTPQTVIIKNKKMVYGYIGSMSTKTLGTITELYGVGSNEKN